VEKEGRFLTPFSGPWAPPPALRVPRRIDSQRSEAGSFALAIAIGIVPFFLACRVGFGGDLRRYLLEEVAVRFPEKILDSRTAAAP
jgi:hypothetical protein